MATNNTFPRLEKYVLHLKSQTLLEIKSFLEASGLIRHPASLVEFRLQSIQFEKFGVLSWTRQIEALQKFAA